MKVGVVGLGSMGYGIAASLLRGGHRVWGATAMVLAELLEALGDTP
jgi:3-hydroxyisobutyrate dehydrogenase